MKKILQNRDDIRLVIESFYEKLLTDELIGHFFEKFKNTQVLEEHIVTLVNFWDNILFYSGTYQKNAMKPHVELSARIPMKKEHFDQWIKLFNASVDQHFTGEMAHTAKTRALSIATVMQIKVFEDFKK